MPEHRRDGADTSPASPEDQPTPSPSVRLLEARDVPAAATMLARAFAEEPAKRALFGDGAAEASFFADPTTRSRFAEAAAEGRLRAALPYAASHVAEVGGTVAGVAIWYPPGLKPSQLPSAVVLPTLLTPGTRVLSLLGHVGRLLWRDRSTLRRALATRAAATKQMGPGPSWYLTVIGTDPAYRGQGVARRLLDRTLERCDVEGLPAWLETTEDSNVPLYERFGFETVAASVPGSVLPGLWVMRRRPRTQS